MPLFFVLGVLARLVRSELNVSDAVYGGLILYPLTAIGLKGGRKFTRSAFLQDERQSLANTVSIPGYNI
ncbi:sodium-dependent bicarbonate transport family permease [Nitrospira sp. KM1]|uniref:sodium-dependent bicarbonate transport family permease n=1 Tax=Nitrospira sp. KM1 TaxID=1936990 RepID=UPI0015642E68|nr:sodium-dependent bicarbonate transport family permease [Nitrospira sp. KM1]